MTLQHIHDRYSVNKYLITNKLNIFIKVTLILFYDTQWKNPYNPFGLDYKFYVLKELETDKINNLKDLIELKIKNPQKKILYVDNKLSLNSDKEYKGYFYKVFQSYPSWIIYLEDISLIGNSYGRLAMYKVKSNLNSRIISKKNH